MTVLVFVEGMTALAYFILPLELLWLLRYVLSRNDVKFNCVLVLFASFIFVCGLGHANTAFGVFGPNTYATLLIHTLTSLVSVATAIVLGQWFAYLRTTMPAIFELVRQRLELESELEQTLMVKEVQSHEIEQHSIFRQFLQSVRCTLDPTKIFESANDSFLHFFYIRCSGVYQYCGGDNEHGWRLEHASHSSAWQVMDAVLTEDEYNDCTSRYLPDGSFVYFFRDQLADQGFGHGSTGPFPGQFMLRIIPEQGDGLDEKPRVRIGGIGKDGQHTNLTLLFDLAQQVQFTLDQTAAIETVRVAASERQSLVEANLKQQADEALRRKTQFMATEFLAIISHELRTPLNAVVASLDLLQLQTHKLDEDTQELIATISSGSSTLLHVLNDILTFTQYKNGQVMMEKQKFDVRKLVQELAKEFHQSAAQRGTTIHVECPDICPLVGDRFRLRQVLANLLSNACKFAVEGRVEVNVRIVESDLTPPDHKMLRIEVSDTGIGIHETQMPRLFQHFSQADSSITRRFGGTGLGLAICKETIELCGGQIWVESVFGQGSTFIFEIPMGCPVKSPVQGAAEAATLQPQLDTPRGFAEYAHGEIWIVEDVPINQKVLRRLLQTLGLPDPKLFCNGFQVVEHFKTRVANADFAANPPIILMDIAMPVMDGLSATKAIREMTTPGQGAPYIVGVSASAFDEDNQRMRDAGMNDVCPKPARLATVRSCLNRAFQTSTTSPELLREWPEADDSLPEPSALCADHRLSARLQKTLSG
eukprot:CAMPEP_0114554056 /NCGR_PEP_ID=MMETSP0114-20121206/8002_1 /TAXON_ID=31324 /ORGANISM="Goniomonas sp, Strain m" /LENGTH=761 /DNA_ID=CAMNT_0001739069 /DNA_START=77 /DNA_END=2362 /DNA_ORIENTATION=-